MKRKKKLIIEPDDTEEIEEVIPDDIIVNYYSELQKKPDDPYHYPISQKEAFAIANRDENLKTDFWKRKKITLHICFLKRLEYVQ